jgi:hypothetical protein
VYYLPYPCEKISAWWVVHKVYPRERLHTLDNAGYHDTPTLDDDVDDVYQEEELSPSFVIDPGAGLDDLVRDADDIEMVVMKRKPLYPKDLVGDAEINLQRLYLWSDVWNFSGNNYLNQKTG